MKILCQALVSIGFLALTACSTGHCRRDGTKVNIKEDVKPPSGYQREHLGSVLIAKSDGSLQCGMKRGLSIQEMTHELEGIEVFSSHKAHDGLMRLQTCGAETGMLNVFEIQAQDLSRAQKLGFSVYENH
ncbi:MAG: hypothetical protein KDD33_12455 [Bdellovibrionales bacterium]|nr:hypothetical protein [Bdellovibrionales bacterium]